MAKVIQITEQAWRNDILPRLRYVDRLRQNAAGDRTRAVTAYRIPPIPTRVVMATLFAPNRWKYNCRSVAWDSLTKRFIEPTSEADILRFPSCYNTYEQNNTSTVVGHNIPLTGTMGILPISTTTNEIVWIQRVGEFQGAPEFAFYAINQFTGCPA